MPGKGRPFQKGTSGNPGGRPKVLGDVQELARQQSPQAIDTLVAIMQDMKAPLGAFSFGGLITAKKKPGSQGCGAGHAVTGATRRSPGAPWGE